MQTKLLRPYQAQGVEKLIELTEKRNAAILADEPGLGKTIQVAEFINRTKPAGPVLIVCPASLRLNWQKELSIWLVWKPFSVETVSYEAVATEKVILTPSQTQRTLPDEKEIFFA